MLKNRMLNLDLNTLHSWMKTYGKIGNNLKGFYFTDHIVGLRLKIYRVRLLRYSKCFNDPGKLNTFKTLRRCSHLYAFFCIYVCFDSKWNIWNCIMTANMFLNISKQIFNNKNDANKTYVSILFECLVIKNMILQANLASIS